MNEQSQQTESVPLFDMHMHLGFFADPADAARQLGQCGIRALCATVTPSEFERLQAADVSSLPNVRLGVGLHPWWIADGRCDAASVERAAQLAKRQRYVAEIGLDFSGGRAESRTAQVEALNAILAACEGGAHVLSIHAVQAAGAVLDALEAHGTCANNEVIFHWFSGSGTALARAVEAGCCFSVNARMLNTKRGRSYAQQIPAAQLLIETDLPGSAESGRVLSATDYASQLRQTAEALACLRGNAVLQTIAETSARLLR